MSSQKSTNKYYFTEEHEWIRFENDCAFVGLTYRAKEEMGLISNIEIHTVGKDLVENQVFGRIRTDKYLCKLIMPISGKVLEANTIDYKKINIIDKDFEHEEWIVRIAVTPPLKTKKLYLLEEYKSNNNRQSLHLVKYFLRFTEPTIK